MTITILEGELVVCNNKIIEQLQVATRSLSRKKVETARELQAEKMIKDKIQTTVWPD